MALCPLSFTCVEPELEGSLTSCNRPNIPCKQMWHVYVWKVPPITDVRSSWHSVYTERIQSHLGNWVHRPVTTSLFQCFQQLPHCCLVGHRTMDPRHQNEAKGCLDIMSHWINVRLSNCQTVSSKCFRDIKAGLKIWQQLWATNVPSTN